LVDRSVEQVVGLTLPTFTHWKYKQQNKLRRQMQIHSNVETWAPQSIGGFVFGPLRVVPAVGGRPPSMFLQDSRRSKILTALLELHAARGVVPWLRRARHGLDRSGQGGIFFECLSYIRLEWFKDGTPQKDTPESFK
jgi:hypothetical protein